MDSRVFCAAILDHEQETSLDELLGSLGLSANWLQAKQSSARSAEVIDLSVNGVRVTLMRQARARGIAVVFQTVLVEPGRTRAPGSDCARTISLVGRTFLSCAWTIGPLSSDKTV